MIEFYGGYEVYSESGVDLTLLRENLKLSPTQRLQKNLYIQPWLNELDNASMRLQSPKTPSERGLPMLDVKELLNRLASHHVEFVLIGGQAMRVHGSAHITQDVDVCYERSTKNLSALALALAPLHPALRGAPAGLPFRLDLLTLKAGLNFTLVTDAGDTDLLGEVSGLGGFDGVFAQSEERVLYGLSIRVLSLEGLIPREFAMRLALTGVANSQT